MTSDMQPQYLINGRHEGCLTPLDRGLAYGDGVFRTFPVRGMTPHNWALHYRKLNEDCNSLGIVCPSEHVLLADIALLTAPDQTLAIKIIVTRGEGARGYAVPTLAQPVRIVIASAMPAYPETHFSEGVRLYPCETRLGLQPRLAGVKHLNRLENVLARMEWVDPQYADGLMLDMEGRVVECTMSNLFFRRGNRLTTPDLSRCGVAGVTRARVLAVAPSLGYEVVIEGCVLQEVLQADEVVICNSLFGAWQVRALAGTTWPAGTMASLLRERLGMDDA